jgi:hypothetical protein
MKTKMCMPLLNCFCNLVVSSLILPRKTILDYFNPYYQNWNWQGLVNLAPKPKTQTYSATSTWQNAWLMNQQIFWSLLDQSLLLKLTKVTQTNNIHILQQVPDKGLIDEWTNLLFLTRSILTIETEKVTQTKHTRSAVKYLTNSMPHPLMPVMALFCLTMCLGLL